MAKNDPPVAKFRIGYVTAAVWQNDRHYNLKLTKSYKDSQSGEWKDGDQFSHGDLLNAMKALERAEKWIWEQG